MSSQRQLHLYSFHPVSDSLSWYICIYYTTIHGWYEIVLSFNPIVPRMSQMDTSVLSIPITSAIMVGFLSSRCLNDRLDLLDKVGLFTGSTTTPLVVKIGTNHLNEKLKIHNFFCNFVVSGGKIWRCTLNTFWIISIRSYIQKSSGSEQNWRRDWFLYFLFLQFFGILGTYWKPKAQ